MPLRKRKPSALDSNPYEIAQIAKSRPKDIPADGPGHVKTLVEIAQEYGLPENCCNEEVLGPLYELEESDAEKTRASKKEVRQTRKPSSTPGTPSKQRTDITKNNENTEIEYTTKDNNKLRAMLLDRRLSNKGTRDEMISTLQQTSLDYKAFLPDEISSLLKNRRLKTPTGDSNETKIATLLWNDHLDRDTGNESDTRLYARLDLLDGTVTRLLKKQDEARTGNRYYSHMSKRLRSHLKRKGLSTAGDVDELQKRALEFDDREDDKWLEMMIAERDLTRSELELSVGRAVLAIHWDISKDGMSRAELEVMGFSNRSQSSTESDLGSVEYSKLYHQELKIMEEKEHVHKQSTDTLIA